MSEMIGSASQAGYYYQNNVAALKIIECLFFNTDITSIRLENYDKGQHIDDIIIYRNHKIEYYQIKWSDDVKNSFTLYNLLSAQAPKKSIFRQLAEGYLTAKQSGLDFSVTLFTNKRESSQKRPSEGLNHSLTEIRTNIFERLKKTSDRYDSLSSYADYRDTLEAIRSECSLDQDSFNDFIKKLELKFGQEQSDQIQNATKFRLERLGIESNLFEKLLDGIVNWSITGEQITKSTILKHLGITDRFEDKISHHFKIVEEKFYVPNEALQKKLETSISELQGGYIFIEGLPGSGKSTALTKFKDRNPDVTIAYYCFIPETNSDFGQNRHKASYFLKSLCLSIEKQFSDVNLPNRYSGNFENKFASYIDKLGTLEKKTIFIIDGLDHVHRDSTLNENSLLNQIKGNLPDGIYFLLSSQYKAVLSSSVATQIESDTRRHIIVNKFAQREIRHYLSNKGIHADSHLDQIENVSEGIPLYLHYISELLLKTEKMNYGNILRNLPKLIDGKINSYHEYLFQNIGMNEFVKWVFAVFANRMENSTADTIYEILKLAGENKTSVDVSKVINDYSHLLRQIDGRTFSIFHNSFREFILSKTDSLKEKFNNALVLFYEQAPFSDEAYRNYFKHLDIVGDYQNIISLTTLDWIKNAWQNFRTLEEIRTNIDIALNACIETLSLSEFIRIVFLKTQFANLSANLEYFNIDFPVLLLDAGETANSLRSIWDGDFVLPDKEYFCNYLGRYYSKTGNLLPQNIVQQGFSKSLNIGNYDQITTIKKAEALASGDMGKLFEDIDKIKWVKSDRHQVGYYKENINNKENAKTNTEIKSEVIDYLFECKKFDELISLSKIFKSNKELLTKIQIALVKLLLISDKTSACKLINKIDLSIITDKSYFEIISYCSDYLNNSEIIQQFPKREVIKPNLHDKVINHEEMNYVIRKDIIELFNDLKPIWLFKPEMINQLLLRVSSLSRPARNIYNSIFYLSELWNKNRNLKLTEDAKIKLVKQSLKELYVPRRKDNRKTNEGLFDHDHDVPFISSSINNLFSTIFNFSIKIFSKEKIEELINYWFTLEESNDGYRHFTVALDIAKEINSYQGGKLTELIHKLIQHSENIVRHEEDTETLTTDIVEVAHAYAISGFKEDFTIIYNQLVELSFGLRYKKDYRSSNITYPLELLHEQDPDGTLDRLSEVFNIQNQLAGVGRSRMHHICLSELVSFTATHFIELAFLLLEKEEKYLWREESIDIVFEPLINKATKEQLPLYFSIVKTLPRWNKGSTKENFFLKISLQLLKKAINFNDELFISDLLEVVKQNTIVELEDLGELEIFSEALIEAGINHTKYSLPTPKKKEEEEVKDKRIPQDEKYLEKFSTPNFTTLITLFEKDYSEFEKFIQSPYEICLRNRRIQTFRNEYYRSKSTFEKFYTSLPDSIQQSSRKNLKSVIKNYIKFKKQVTNFNPNSFLKFTELECFFNDFVTETNSLFPDNAFKDFIEKEFEKDKWIENILQFVNDNRDYIFKKVISEENIIGIVKQVSILKYDELLAFINKWTAGTINSIASKIIANRLFPIDPSKAKKILLAVTEYETDNLLIPLRDSSIKLEFDIIETSIKSDEEFGKKYLLRSYISQNTRYEDNLIDSFDKLLKYRDHFDEKDVINIFYESHIQYNQELARGISEKEDKYGFIREHNETLDLKEITIKYLVKYFDYPVVKVRELTLQSVFDLVYNNNGHLKDLFKYGITKGTNNQIEHCLVVFHSISIKNPKILLQFKKELISITNTAHFNILESLKELLFRLNEFGDSFLSTDEISNLNKLNSTNPILYSNRLLTPQKKKNFIYSSFQVNLLKELYDNEDDITEIQDDIYADLVAKDLGNYKADEEGSIHRYYNINTNFDTIEIQSHYTDELKNSINKIFHSKIKRNCFEKSFVDKIKTKFRLFDPFKLLYKTMPKPSYVNWLTKDISEFDFNGFEDFDILANSFVNRENEYVTLVEFGSQRSGHKYDDFQAICYFEVYAYLKKDGLDDSVLDNGKRKISPIITNENLYSYELPSDKYSTKSFPINEIQPIIEISYNNFRGESDLVLANLLSDVFRDFGIEKISLTEIMQIKKDYQLEGIRWQNAYTSGVDRRRYKATSEGYLLKIKRKTLMNYLSKNNLVLCYDIYLRRSTTKHRPEAYMDWYDLNRRIEATLD